MVKKDMAAVFADFVAKHHAIFAGKTLDEIHDMVKKKHGSGDSDNITRIYAAEMHEVFTEFSGKGPVEIEDDLDRLPKDKFEDLYGISGRLIDFV